MGKHIAISFLLFISIFAGVLTAHCAVDELNSLRPDTQQVAHFHADSRSHQHENDGTSDENHQACHSGNCMVLIQSSEFVLLPNPIEAKFDFIPVNLVHFESLLYRPPIS